VKKAFRDLCLKWHPDLCPPGQVRSPQAEAVRSGMRTEALTPARCAQRQQAEQAFRDVAQAYAALSGRARPAPWLWLVCAPPGPQGSL